MRASVTLDSALHAKHKRIQPMHLMSIEEAAKACASLAQKAREAAAGVDLAWEQLEQSGALGEVVRYARSQGIDLPRTDVTEAARTLKAYAGAILLYAGSLRTIDRRVVYESSVGTIERAVAN